ncbi:hypothetical protein M413DRAFT_432581 [Hebeloma cylindrosporum]|uniref:Uncharacterized protein n=1 Tax=Hebeloma cylindrosporum TaxID=76867 RepID=A0A0C2YVC1_HEBCY|nr:hypothetical protein M413DRAFT_432581 [Hebeloma cylindrosporum h7]
MVWLSTDSLAQVLERVLLRSAPRHAVSNYVLFYRLLRSINSRQIYINISDEELLRLRREGSGFELYPSSFGTHNIPGKVTIFPKLWSSISKPSKHPFRCTGCLNLVIRQSLPWNTFRGNSCLWSCLLCRGLDGWLSCSSCTPISMGCENCAPTFRHSRPTEWSGG